MLEAILALTLAVLTPRQDVVGPQTTMTVQQFMADLANYGVWRSNDQWGWYWQPTGVGPGWRPYSYGKWVVSEGFGLYWQSNEPYGWAVYHYGRWMWIDNTGWVWIPDKQWGPGFVNWAYGEGYVAWAPMPPSGPGKQTIVQGPLQLPPWQWTIVPQAQLFATNVWQWAIPSARNANLMQHIPQHTIWRGDSDYSLPREMVAAICANPDPAQPIQFMMTPIGVAEGNAQGAINAYAPQLTGDAQPLANQFRLLPPTAPRPPQPPTPPQPPQAPTWRPVPPTQGLTQAQAQARQQQLLSVYQAGEAQRLALAQQMDPYNPPVSAWSAANAGAWAASDQDQLQQQAVRDQSVMAGGGYGGGAYVPAPPPISQAAP